MATAGDDFDAAFRELFLPAFHLARRLLGDPGDAQDAAAEAMARALADWGRVGALPYRRAFVLRVTANVAVDMLRKRRAIPDSDAVARLLAEVEGDGADVETGLRLREALRRLPARQREVVVLRYVADVSEEDVASSLGISTGAVKAHASRGLARLRQLIGASSRRELQEVQIAY